MATDRMNVLDQHIDERFAAYHGDCVEVVKALPDRSVGLFHILPTVRIAVHVFQQPARYG